MWSSKGFAFLFCLILYEVIQYSVLFCLYFGDIFAHRDIKFMCQRDWAMEFPDVRSSVILGLSVRVFLGEINILISRVGKADCPG